MDVYNVPLQGLADAYMIQGTEPNQHLASLMPEQFQAMYSEGTPEFVVDQGMFYPTAASYGYYCTGYEPPIDSDDHHRVFGLDGQDMQYVGAQADSLPFVYYSPNYGYTQSPYNPYNPYIPGALVGVDNSFLGSQQYYSHPAYDSASSAYVPAVIQSRSEDPYSPTVADSSAPTVNRGNGLGLKHNISSTSKTFNLTPARPAASQTTSFQRSSEGNRSSAGTTKQPSMHGGLTLGSVSQAQGRSAHSAQNVTHGKTFSNRDQLRASLSTGNGLTSYGSSSLSSNLIYKGIADDQKAKPGILVEHNKHLRAHKLSRQLVVKAYTRKAGTMDEQGNITIDTDQYNRDDFLLDFQKAKFFVIKSYSEDDVHKSIKYSVWSSTPNGNRKLQGAYDDAQRFAAGGVSGCPIFLFFSVNASGQFCGVAEMTGPVDFSKDMDFWQQDKWSGSFPVKWHIIKDAPNPTFRHIILETNENKPVTNSRDTQEIPFKKGFEMLKIFKSHASRTSLFDDFMYYENRQRILQEERARFLIKSYGTSYIVPAPDPPHKIAVPDMPSDKGEHIVKHNDLDNPKEYLDAAIGHKPEAQEIARVDSLRINSLTIGPKKSQGEKIGSLADTTTTTTPEAQETASIDSLRINSLTIGSKKPQGEKIGSLAATAPEAQETATIESLRINSLTIGPKKSQGEKMGSLAATTTNASPLSSTSSPDVVTVGSMPIKLNGNAKSSGILTIGTITLDPRALSHNEFKNDTNKG